MLPLIPLKSGCFVVTLMIPEEVFRPNRVPCGPRRISMPCRSPNSERATPVRALMTPSMMTPTEDSRPGLVEVVPTPRMRIEESAPPPGVWN